MIVAGVVLAVPAGIFFVLGVVRALGGTIERVPGTVTRQLGAGKWFIYERTGVTVGFVTHTNDPVLDPSEVTVTGPGGAAVEVVVASEDDSITRGREQVTAELEFDAPAPGKYTLQFATPPTYVIVARPLIKDFAKVLLPLGLTLAGGAVVLVGIILLVVGITRRSRSKGPPWSGPPPPTFSVPPGWYADPAGPGRRWWDGRTWTDNQA